MTSFRSSEIAAVYLNGAFFTGFALDSRQLVVHGYDDAQRRVLAELQPQGQWSFDEVRHDQAGMRFSIAGKYASLVPVTFMSRVGDALAERFQALLDSGDTALDEAAKATWDRLGLTLRRVEIDLFDLGIGVMAVTLRLCPRPAASLTELRAGIELVSVAMTAPANKLIFETVGALQSAVEAALPTTYVTPPWFQDEGALTDASRPGEPQSAASRTVSLPARLLWLHRTYLFRVWDPTLEPQFDVLLPSVHERYTHPQLLLIAGIGSSVIHLRSAASEEAEEAGLIRVRDLLSLIDLQWAYIAAIMEIDRVLLRRLNQLAILDSTASMTALESEASSLLELSDRVRLFRSTIDSIIIDLGGGTRGLWDTIARVQTIPEILATVDDKLTALRSACDARLAAAAARRQQRIALTIDVFAGFSVVASVAQIATFASGAHVVTGVRVILLCMTVALVVTALTLNRFARPGRP